jgi:hypothetical protein
MSAIADAMVEVIEAGVVPVFCPDYCPDLEQDGEHGLVWVTITTRFGEPLRLSGLLPEDADDYLESCGTDNEVGQSMQMILDCDHMRSCMGADGQDTPNDYECTHCGKTWNAYNTTNNRSGRRSPCPSCREMCRPTAASQQAYRESMYS